MKKILLLIYFGLLISSNAMLQVTNQEDTSKKILTNQQWLEDLEFTVKKLSKVHPNLYYRISRDSLDLVINRARSIIVNSNTDAECFFAIRKVIASLKDGHTNLFLNGKIDFVSVKLPIIIGYFGDGFFVEAVEKKNQDIIGLKVIAVNGVPIEQVIQKLCDISSCDNSAGLTDRAVSYLRYPLILKGVGIVSGDSELTYSLIDKNGEMKLITINQSKKIDDNDLISVQSCLGLSTPLYLKNLTKNYWFEEMENERTLYTQINVLENQRGENDSFEGFTKNLFEYFDKKSSSIDKFIIDLRYNNGGNGRMAIPFVKEIVKRDRLNIRGKLYVIIGSKTYSAAIVMATSLLEYTEAIFVGSKSACPANMFSNSTNIGNLPNSGYGLSISTRQIDNGWMSNREYFKIDIPVLTTGEEYFAGTDPELHVIIRNEAIPLAELAEQKGTEAAYEFYRKIIEKYPDISWWCSSDNLESDINLKGYQQITKKQMDKAEQILVLNTLLFPDSWNVWDSAAEIYFMNGKKDLCIKALEKSLELNPENNNAIEGLKQLKK
jgi:tetratricopeptide (TPR) repeat protein